MEDIGNTEHITDQYQVIGSNLSKASFFYVDESFLEIEGKKHLMLGAVCPNDPGSMAARIVQMKNCIGLAPFDEIKWNTKGLTQEQRAYLCDGMIRILSEEALTVLVSIVEGTDRHKACLALTQQIRRFCNDQSIPAFALYLDEGIVPRLKDLVESIGRMSGMPLCIGLQAIVSSREQLMQACDVFIGAYARAMRNELSGEKKQIRTYDELLDEEIEWTFSDFVIVYTRYLVWGNTQIGKGDLPYKRCMGYGFQIDSTISAKSLRLLRDRVATVYMGCMH